MTISAVYSVIGMCADSSNGWQASEQTNEEANIRLYIKD